MCLSHMRLLKLEFIIKLIAELYDPPAPSISMLVNNFCVESALSQSRLQHWVESKRDAMQMTFGGNVQCALCLHVVTAAVDESHESFSSVFFYFSFC